MRGRLIETPIKIYFVYLPSPLRRARLRLLFMNSVMHYYYGPGQARINPTHDHTKGETNPQSSSSHPPTPASPTYSMQKTHSSLSCVLSFPSFAHSCPSPPRSLSCSAISSAIIPLFCSGLAQLIGCVCSATWGPDIIAGQIARCLASDLSRLSCAAAQTQANWKA